MFAVVTKFDKYPHSRRLKIEFSDPVCRISIGDRVRSRRLKRVLEPFGNRVLAADGINLHGIKLFDTAELKEEILFEQFCRHVLSRQGIALSVGVFDPSGKYLDRREMTEIIAHAASVTVFTLRNVEALCQGWLSSTGTCPEVVDKKAWLYGCDCAFAPNGLVGFESELFGHGGQGIDQSKLQIPEDTARFVPNVNAVDLYCMLRHDPDFSLDTTDRAVLIK